MTLNRSRTKSGREREKRNDTQINTLRGEYGERFARGFRGDTELGTLKKQIGLPAHASLDDVLRHYHLRRRN